MHQTSMHRLSSHSLLQRTAPNVFSTSTNLFSCVHSQEANRPHEQSGNLAYRRPLLCRPGLSNCNSDVFQKFVVDWLRQFGIECENEITLATEAEKYHFQTNSKMYRHCRIYLKNFYPTIFFGSGFGPRIKECCYSAAKSMVIFLQKNGFISEELFQCVASAEQSLGGARMGNELSKLELPKHPHWFYSKRLMNAFMELVNKQSFPAGFKEGKPDFKSYEEAMYQLINTFQIIKPTYGVCPVISQPRPALADPAALTASGKITQPSTSAMYGQPFNKAQKVAFKSNSTTSTVADLSHSTAPVSSAVMTPDPVAVSQPMHADSGNILFLPPTNLQSGFLNKKKTTLHQPEDQPPAPIKQLRPTNLDGVASTNQTVSPSNVVIIGQKRLRKASSIGNLAYPHQTRLILARKPRAHSAPVNRAQLGTSNTLKLVFSPVKPDSRDQAILGCSSDASTQLCDTMTGNAVASAKAFDWNKHFGVSPAGNSSAVYSAICVYKQRYVFQFHNFNQQIWDHFTNNLQVGLCAHQVNGLALQNDETFAWKMRIRKDLNDVLHEVNPECSLIPVGSTINGCGAYNEDMDLCLWLPIPAKKIKGENSYTLNTLKRFKKRLAELSVVSRVECIRAQVPMLKVWFKQAYEQLEVKMSVNNELAIFNSYLVHHYSRVDDKFPALCLLVKHWANRVGINQPTEGTFNSYSLILMVLHFLQVGSDPPVLPNLQKLYPDFFSKDLDLEQLNIFGELPTPLPDAPRNNKSIGELLIAFFHYYTHFDYQHMAISIAKGKAIDRCEVPKNSSKVFIEDPFQRQLNTAATVVGDQQWHLIKKAFTEAKNSFLHPEVALPPSLLALKVARVC